jgi:FtsP/CotA-like multicopper oxidase with cupredoxin domain
LRGSRGDAGQAQGRGLTPAVEPSATAEQGARFGRRALLGAGAAAALTLLSPVRPRSGGLGLPGPAQAWAKKLRPFRSRLAIPPVITDAAIEIEMREARIAVLPGRKTKMWTYDGSFPGPTIRRPAGQPTEVTFVHRLPASAGELTVHLHGGHNRSADDGQPGGLTAAQPRALYCDIDGDLSPRQSGNDLLIAPGARRTYRFDGIEDGAPERGSFQWYHDHRLERTAANVWRGLAGMWIVDDEFDAALPLPRGRRDIPLMISDRSFDRRNQLTDPFGAAAGAPDDGTTGRVVLINGRPLPHHRVSATRHRLRVLNASHFRSYNLALSNGAAMTQIATESGLMPRPVRRRRVLIGPGERVELIVDFASARGRRVELVSVARANGPRKLGSTAYTGPLMQFRVGERAPDDSSVPATLRPLPDWVAAAPQRAQRSWRFTVGSGLRPRWLINGNAFDPARVDARPELDTTETWELHNQTSVGHLIHMHHTDWCLLSRNGRAPKPWEACLKETFFLDPGDRVLVAGHFSDYTGKYVIHCHMLDHEDHGLMGQFEVVEPGQGDLALGG